MTLRLISSFAALPIFFLVIYFLPSIFFPITIAVLCLISVYELLWRSHIIEDKALMSVAYFYAAAIPFWAHFGFTKFYTLPGIFVLTVSVFVIWMFRIDSVKFAHVTAVIFASVVIPFFLSATIGIFNMTHGKVLILAPFIAAWMTDTGAYFAGTFLGKHKMASKVSPKKTWEGAIGGILVCIISFLVYGVILEKLIAVQVSYITLAVAGLVLSIIAEIGDLSLSVIKREYNIKDYGVIFPGHGGILDRFDSVLFTAPATLIIISMVHMVL